MYTIENDYLKVTLNEKGAALWSVKDNTGHEYLWQGDAKYWVNRAPNLFPYIGRMTEGKYTLDGNTYEMNIHGFSRDMVFVAERISKEHIVFQIEDTSETYKQYPFKFEFSVVYRLEGAKIIMSYEVKNKDEKQMYFGVGGHPGFFVPMDEETKFEDWYLEFDSKRDVKRVEMSEKVFVTERLLDFPLEAGVKLSLEHSLFDHDAVVLTNVSPCVSLKSDKSKREVRVEYPQMPYVGFWHMPKTDAPYVCIEPWSSLPSREGIVEDLKTQPGLIALNAGCDYTNKWSIEIIFPKKAEGGN